MFGDRFSSSTSCSGWLHETTPARPDPSLSCLFLKVATHPSDALRSTKAGASTPATHKHALMYGSDALRSTKAGASTPATHTFADVTLPEWLTRSTKAGASTPATRAPSSPSPSWSPALNEGRSVNPGDTRAWSRGFRNRVSPLNEGRSVNPGDTAKFCKGAVSGQTIARPRAREPRRRRVCGHFTRFGRYPVRMVRIKRRDCLDRGPSTRGFRESLRVRR